MYCRRNSRSRGGRTTEITITGGQLRRDSNERNRQPRVHSMQIDDPAFAHRLLEYVMNNFGARGTATAAGRQSRTMNARLPGGFTVLRGAIGGTGELDVESMNYDDLLRMWGDGSENRRIDINAISYSRYVQSR